MTDKAIPLEKEGVYLFAAPNLLRASIDRQVLVVFLVPYPKACGVLLYDPRSPNRDLPAMLEMLWAKLCAAHGATTESVQIKLFGGSYGEKVTLRQVYKWLTAKRLRLAAEDTGRNATRSVVIDCGSGLIGISYAEAHPAGIPVLLSAGSARLRGGETAPSIEALVLCGSPVRRQLARQVVEEGRGWAADAPAKPEKLLAGKPAKNFRWPLVLVFSDLLEETTTAAKLLKWVAAVRKASPTTAFLFSGEDLGASLRRLGRSLPPLEPDSVVTFKTSYQDAIAGDFGWATGRVVRFPKKKAGRSER